MWLLDVLQVTGLIVGCVCLWLIVTAAWLALKDWYRK